MKSEATPYRRRLNIFMLTSVLIVTVAGYTPTTHAADSKPVNIAVYRGEAGCEGCSEMVVKSLAKTGLKLSISYIGENEKLKLNRHNLKNFDLYIQPGGGQDIPAAYDAIGDDGAEAIRDFVRSGKGYLGLCMGAYLADRNWIGLINAPLDSEVGRPGADAHNEGDYTLSVKWDGKKESFYYQDGPFLSNSTGSPGYTPIAYYNNGDVAMAAYAYGKGNVVLTGPHPEADESWIDASKPGYIPAQSKMTRLLNYLAIAKE
ncbi:BPL-N domain-containing protein [Kosakonia sp. BK9b]